MLRTLCFGFALALCAASANARLQASSLPHPGTEPPAEEMTASSQPESKALPAGMASLTQIQALRFTLEHHPDLAAYAFELRARDAALLQAGVLPNPILEVELENFAGSRDFGGLGGAETTLGLSQLIEIGGKRVKRKRIASLDKDLARWQYEGKRLDLLTATAKAFVRVLVAQEKVALQEELYALAQRMQETVAARVEAGKVSPLEATKTNVILASTALALKQTRRELQAARILLASSWGDTSPRFERVEGSLVEVTDLAPLDSLENLIENNPDVARWSTITDRGRARLALAKTKPIPDLTLKGGVRYLEDSKTFVAGVSLPLPWFNRHKGTIRQAQNRLFRAQMEARGAQIRAATSLATIYQNLQAARERVLTIKEHILSGTQRTFEGVSEGYREGKFALLDVLDAQRTLFEAKHRYIGALADYHLLQTDLKRIIGRRLIAPKSGKREENNHEQ